MHFTVCGRLAKFSARELADDAAPERHRGFVVEELAHFPGAVEAIENQQRCFAANA